MVNFLETLYAVTVLSALVAAHAWVRARGPGARRAAHRRRFRRFGAATLLGALAAAALYAYLGAR